jgi:integrase
VGPGVDIDSGRKKGRVRDDGHALRFVEVTVNGPKTWSLAAALHPEISSALDAAQDRAANEIVGWVASHATTRVGPRGRWRSTRADAGLNFKLHELRHYLASGLIAAGCDVVTVQRAMGHASATTTLSTYADLWPSAEGENVEFRVTRRVLLPHPCHIWRTKQALTCANTLDQ